MSNFETMYAGDSWHCQVADKVAETVEGKKAIVYMDFVKDVSPVTIALREKGVKSAAFHGKKLTASDKSKLVSNWRDGVIHVMVCTKAFGMGIDQPDVEVVVRIGCPPSLEDWAQELGRAGRDGRQATGNLVCQQ